MGSQEITALIKHKKSDVAAILGSARSINAITEGEWEKLCLCDTLALNNWVYHPFFVPNFYMIEVKSYDFSIVKRRLQEKWAEYQHCRYIFARHKSIRMPAGNRVSIRELVPPNARVFEYDCVRRNPKRVGTIDAKYKPQALLTKTADASVTLALELLWRMGYKTIVLYGMDFYHRYYFWWDGDPKYGEVHQHTNKEHEGADPDTPYACLVAQDFIKDFSKRWMWEQGRGLYVGGTDTTLYPDIPLIDWNTHVL